MAIFTEPLVTEQSTAGIDFASHEIEGQIHSVRAVGEDGWHILMLNDGRQITGTWESDEIARGVCYRFFGVWVTHSQFGPQFRCDTHVLADEHDRRSLTAYLDRYKLFTRSEANALFDAFGGSALHVIRDNPESAAKILSDARGGKYLEASSKVAEASEKLKLMTKDEPARVDLYGLFGGRGVPRGAVEACIKRWGSRAGAIIRQDPFKLVTAEIPGIGFKRADKLYLDLGKNPARLKRQIIAAWHGLREERDGNTWEPIETVARKIAEGVGVGMALTEHRGQAMWERALAAGIRAHWLTRRVDGGRDWIAERGKANAERRLAEHTKRIMRYAPILPAFGYSSVEIVDRGEVKRLSPSQVVVVSELINHPLMILAGCPGVGKTMTAAAIIRRGIQQLGPASIAVCAPTGKAAVRITEVMQQYGIDLQAKTIHSLLGVMSNDGDEFEFEFNESNPLPADLIVMDEGSMCDTSLAAALFASVKPGGNVLIVGDHYQLPPVGHGAPLRDLIAANMPLGMLTEIRRNSGAIVAACSRIKDGAMPAVFIPGAADVEAGENLLFIESATNIESRMQWVSRVIEHVRGAGEHDPIWDLQVLCATNDTRKELNVLLQCWLNPPTGDEPTDSKGGRGPFRVGDKIICRKNTRTPSAEFNGTKAGESNPMNWRKTAGQTYLANGDLGRVMAIKGSTSAYVRFVAPERFVQITTEKVKKDEAGKEYTSGDFELAYAITVHKSQGSQAPIIIVVLEDSRVASREHIYTAISRASKVCVMIGSMQTVAAQVGRKVLELRRTFLRELITEGTERTGGRNG